MTMQTVRKKALRNNPYSTFGKRTQRQRCDRVSKAINTSGTLKELPNNVQELLTERSNLRAEIITISIKSIDPKDTATSVLIARKTKRIKAITLKLENRQFHV